MSGLNLTLTSNPRIPTGHSAFASAAAAAATNLGTAGHTVAACFGMAITAAARQAEETATALRIFMAADQVEPHAFTPDLDLACTHPRCTFTAEQH